MPQATDKNGASGGGLYYQVSERSQIRNFITMEMLRGMGYAAVVILGLGLAMWVIHLLGMLLPEDSKNAPPPMPYSFVLPEAAAHASA